MIETEIWKKHPEKAGVVIFDRQRTAQEIFSELEVHLKSDGRMPDEYFFTRPKMAGWSVVSKGCRNLL